MRVAPAKTVTPARVATATVVIPYVLAAVFGLWSLRGLASHVPVDTDAARHAMNGVFFHDAVRHGDPLHLLAFAKSYYSQYPALSMPYHPPLFPLVEAVFFLGFGVNILAARIAIALATAISAVLLYKLVEKTHGSRLLAAVSTAIFFTLPSTLVLPTDVMLEMPTLVVILIAIRWLPGLDGAYGLRRGMAYALIAAAAVWTKQNAIFLGLVPFAAIAFEGRWAEFKRLALWGPAAVFGVFVVALALLAAVFGVTGNAKWPRFDPIPILRHNVPYYINILQNEFGLVALLVITAALVVAVVKHRFENAPYLAWAACVFLVAFLMPPYDVRYIFFAYPAMIVVACSVLLRLARQFLPARAAVAVPVAVAVLWGVAHAGVPPVYLHGPAEAASLIAPSHPDRVLYCGRSNGNFTFALRALDPALHTAVIRGDKLPHDVFAPDKVERFAHDYGVDFVVLERSAMQRPWDALFNRYPASFVFVKDLGLASSDRWMNGSLRIFRFTNPSGTPESTLKLHASGITLDAELPSENQPR